MTSRAPASASHAPYRDIPLGSRCVEVDRRGDGSILVRATEALGPHAGRLTDVLEAHARTHPERVFVASRDPATGVWLTLRYAEAWHDVQRIAQALVERGLGPERPVAILSESGIEHALLALAALHVGIPYCAITPAYSLLSADHAKLGHVLGLLQPGLVFADDAAAFETAIERAAPPQAEVVHVQRACARRSSTPWSALLEREPTDAMVRAAAQVTPDSVAKVLFTSGSTGMPKGVINTQRMLACNQQMMVQAFPAIGVEPLVILSWLPWHHTSGGNQMLGLTLHCAGTLYLDDGKPVPGDVERTVRNLREVAPTVYFSVPRGFAMLLPFLRADDALRDRFFSRLRMLYYSGAALNPSLARELAELSVAACGVRTPMMSGYGATETAPAALAANWLTERSGLAGLPIPGCELKLVPVAPGRFEARLRGPNVTPGYWGQPEADARLFDDEGFARLGDALSWVAPDDPQQGLAFEGRIAEDFKLSTGTWVSVGGLRAALLQAGDGLFLDAVMAGEGQDEVGAFIVADRAAAAACCEADPELSWPALLSHPAFKQRVQAAVDALAARGTGSSTFVGRALVLEEPPSAAAGELTDKGSVNQRAFLANRAPLVSALFAMPPGPGVLVARRAI